MHIKTDTFCVEFTHSLSPIHFLIWHTLTVESPGPPKFFQGPTEQIFLWDLLDTIVGVKVSRPAIQFH